MSYRTLCATALLSACAVSGAETVSAPILNGADADILNAPWMVSLQFWDSDTDEADAFCGGSLVAPYWILTAAHCFSVDGDVSGTGLRAVMGTTELSLAASEGQIRSIDEVLRYPGFDLNHFERGRDIALVHVVSEFDISDDAVSTIRFADRQSARTSVVETGALATVFGWGRTFDAQGSDTLQHITLPIADLDEAMLLHETFISDDQIAVGDIELTGFDTEAACQGDSGGPLIMDAPEKACVNDCLSVAYAACVAKAAPGGAGQPVSPQDCPDPYAACFEACPTEKLVAGVVSWGRVCGRFGQPNLYANPGHARYEKWLEAIIKGELPPYTSPGFVAPDDPLEGLYANKHRWLRNVQVDVPPRSTNVTVSLSGGVGDADLFVRAGLKPYWVPSTYDCASRNRANEDGAFGNEESCSIPTVDVAPLHVGVWAHEAFEAVDVSVSYDAPALTQLTLDSALNVSGEAGWAQMFALEVEAGTLDLMLEASLASSGNANLYVRVGQPVESDGIGGWVADASEIGSGSHQISLNVPAGIVYVAVVSPGAFRQRSLLATMQ